MIERSRSSHRVERAFGLVATISLVAWLAGNAYEEIVIVPNFVLSDAVVAMRAFRAFFHASNPAFYYLPLTPAIIASSIVNVMYARRERSRCIAHLAAVGCVLIALLLTAWIVVHVNLRLFFGPVMLGPIEARALAVEWLVLNAVRISLVAAAIYLVRMRPPATA